MFKNLLNKFRNWYKNLPDSKKYVEFVTAVLTVPVLLTVLISNLNNINNKKEPAPTPAPTEKIVIVTSPVTPATTISPTLSPTAPECKKEFGPVKINRPSEGELVTTDKVCIDIGYKTGEYCSVQWSYKINSNDWSDFTDKTICIQNLTPGPKELQVKVKSSQSEDEIILIRNFYFKSKENSLPNLTLTPTP